MSDTSNVVDLDVVQPSKAHDLANGIALIARWRRILAIRWFVLLALIGGIINWLVVITSPDVWHVAAGVGYSVGVLIPLLVLYFLTHRAD